MPIYEYRCKKCGKKFEELVTSSDIDEKIDCPKCGSKESERLFSCFSSSSTSNSSSSSCIPRSGFS